MLEEVRVFIATLRLLKPNDGLDTVSRVVWIAFSVEVALSLHPCRARCGAHTMKAWRWCLEQTRMIINRPVGAGAIVASRETNDRC
jgi:hypothetical protein